MSLSVLKSHPALRSRCVTRPRAAVRPVFTSVLHTPIVCVANHGLSRRPSGRSNLLFSDRGDVSARFASIAASASGEAQTEPSNSGIADPVVRGRLLLVGVAIAFASLGVAIKYVLSMPGAPSPSVLSTVRGIISALCFVPLLLKVGKEAIAKEQQALFWRACAELAILNTFSQGFLNVGLCYTDATRAAFLTQTAIVLTPIVAAFGGEKITRTIWASCILALLGVVALGADGGASASVGLNFGDILALLGAGCYSIYIVRISAFAKAMFPGELTQAWKTILGLGLYSGWALFDVSKIGIANAATLWPGWRDPVAWACLAFTAIVPGAMADVMQAKAQESVSPSETQVLLASEPLFATAMSCILLGEKLGSNGVLGSGLLILAVLLASGVIDALKSKTKTA